MSVHITFISSRFADFTSDSFLSLSLSVPYTPPRPDYLSLQEVVKRVPNYGYQLYFADPSSTAEIESKVYKCDSAPNVKFLIFSLLYSAT